MKARRSAIACTRAEWRARSAAAAASVRFGVAGQTGSAQLGACHLEIATRSCRVGPDRSDALGGDPLARQAGAEDDGDALRDLGIDARFGRRDLVDGDRPFAAQRGRDLALAPGVDPELQRRHVVQRQVRRVCVTGVVDAASRPRRSSSLMLR